MRLRAPLWLITVVSSACGDDAARRQPPAPQACAREESDVGEAIAHSAPANTTYGTGSVYTLPSSLPALPDFRPQDTYLGFQGGLYPDGCNDPPPDHLAAGTVARGAIEPLNTNGEADPTGKVVMLGIGMSNTTQEFCSPDASPRPSCSDWRNPSFCIQGNAQQACSTWSFMGRAAADASTNNDSLVIVDGARGGQASTAWVSPSSAEYPRIRTLLSSLSLSRHQVQVMWIKVADMLMVSPTTGAAPVSLANSAPPPETYDLACLQTPVCDHAYTYADAYRLKAALGQIVRTVKTEYPNLRQVFLSSRIWAAPRTGGINPEPFAFEGGFAVKWLVEAQITQARQQGASIDTLGGDLSYADNTAPWIGWGPYLWANGSQPLTNDPLSDLLGLGEHLKWTTDDLEGDGTHPYPSVACVQGAGGCAPSPTAAGSDVEAQGRGEAKVGERLQGFFKHNELTQCWFNAGGTCD